MNAISEFDLEVLEDYLDDALSPGQVEHVARRLANEPELALAMHELRAARVLRAAAWRTLEPSEAAAAAVSGRVSDFIRRADWNLRSRAVSLVGGAIAAVIVVFVAGWLLRGPASPRVAASHGMNPATGALPAHASPATDRPAVRAFHVALLDSRGNVIPVQQFSKADDARQFAQDLMNYEDRREDAQQGSAVLVSDRF